MPGKEIKGTSKIANYRHGGRAGFSRGGGSAPFLRGRSGSSNLKSPRGHEGMKRILEADKKIPFKKLKLTKKKGTKQADAFIIGSGIGVAATEQFGKKEKAKELAKKIKKLTTKKTVGTGDIGKK